MIDIWEDVRDQFQDYSLVVPDFHAAGASRTYRLSIDPSDTIALIHAAYPADGNLEPFRERLRASGPTRTWSHLDFRINSEGNETPRGYSLIGRLLQQLFLAMNLAVPGSCSLFSPIFVNCNIEGVVPPHLPGSVFDDAAWMAKRWGWPHVQTLPFETTWAWVQNTLWNVDSATRPHEKAAFTLLEIAPRDGVDPGSIMLLAQALESLFVDETQGISKLLRERVEALFGRPTSHNKWMTKFYDLRSRVAHGSASFLRPGDYHFRDDDFNRMVDENHDLVFRAQAVLLATLQDMIVHGASGYSFSQNVSRVLEPTDPT